MINNNITLVSCQIFQKEGSDCSPSGGFGLYYKANAGINRCLPKGHCMMLQLISGSRSTVWWELSTTIRHTETLAVTSALKIQIS